MQFFKGQKDVKDLICAKVEFSDLLALKAVNKDLRDYINKHHLDKLYRYCLGNPIQIGGLRGSAMSYTFPAEVEILDSFPKAGKVSLFVKRGDAKEAIKAAHTVDVQDQILTRALFLVRINLPCVPNAKKLVSYSGKDPVNGTVDKFTMIVNEVDAQFLVPCRAMILDDQNRIMKHNFQNKNGKYQQLNYINLLPSIDDHEDVKIVNNRCIIA